METVDDVYPVAEDLLDGGKERLGHIQHDHFNPIEFVLRTSLEPGDDIVGTPARKRGDGLTFLQVDAQRLVAVPRAPSVCINTDSGAELAWTSATTPCKGPAKQGACGEAIATRELFAWTTP